jgi:flagellar biosynthesis/type III secretory pathway M-ring protein FliF/YscJ
MNIWEKSNEFPDDPLEGSDARLSEPQGLHSESPGLPAESQDVIFDEAMANFKLSLDAWSEAAYSTRRVAEYSPRRNWRPAAAWTLGCALIASSVSGVVYQRHEREVEAKQAAANLAAQQKQAADQQAVDEEDLLASVDSDVSRQVPSAMEPLAQMAEDDGK